MLWGIRQRHASDQPHHHPALIVRIYALSTVNSEFEYEKPRAKLPGASHIQTIHRLGSKDSVTTTPARAKHPTS